MKVSLNWLREVVDFREDAARLAQLLTMAGVEVEDIARRGADFPKVVAALILASEQHPNADRLSVCSVDDGSGRHPQIVCGAKNYKVGDKVLLAQPGAVLPGDFKIRVGKLRGVDSEGMLCSASELGLPGDSTGLLLLDPSSEPGTPVATLFPADTVLDLEITPNRPDLLSHEGIAREVAALTGSAWHPRAVFTPETADPAHAPAVGEGCALYSVRRFENVTVASSPEWMSQRLEALGMRAINNVVDITNWVMFETGQPLHAFDADKLRGNLSVRLARDGETIEALDAKTYTLSENDLVIADDTGPVAIAGVMGGAATAVDERTTRVALESAAFSAPLVRRTSRTLGLSSESSYRFERGVDAAGALRASQRAAALLGELTGARAVELRVGGGDPAVDLEALLMGLTPVRHVPLRLERVASLLGAVVPEPRIAEILGALGLSKSDGGWDVPTHRGDLTREVDLIEEIARIVGIEHFPASTRAHFSPASAADEQYDRLMQIRWAAVGQGLFEARSLTLVSERMAASPFVNVPLRRVKNPLNEDQVVLRPALVPGLLEAAARNARGGVKRVRLFEVGRVFSAEGAEERTHLGVVLAGPAAAASWRHPDPAEADLFDLKGVLAAVLGRTVEFSATPSQGSLGVTVRVLVDGTDAGIAGQLRPSEAKALDLGGALLAAEIALDARLGRPGAPARFHELPRFPHTTRDIALVAPANLPHGRVVEVLKSAQEPLLQEVNLFDVFTDPTGVRVPEGAKSLGYSLTYRSAERTLTTDEVNSAHTRLKQLLAAQLGVLPRE
jgi:phenylalanyl-tRNA synthetase beta chain